MGNEPVIEKDARAVRRLPPFLGGTVGFGAAWASAEIMWPDYTDLLHVAVALAGLTAGWLVGLAIAAGMDGSE